MIAVAQGQRRGGAVQRPPHRRAGLGGQVRETPGDSLDVLRQVAQYARRIRAGRPRGLSPGPELLDDEGERNHGEADTDDVEPPAALLQEIVFGVELGSRLDRAALAPDVAPALIECHVHPRSVSISSLVVVMCGSGSRSQGRGWPLDRTILPDYSSCVAFARLSGRLARRGCAGRAPLGIGPNGGAACILDCMSGVTSAPHPGREAEGGLVDCSTDALGRRG